MSFNTLYTPIFPPSLPAPLPLSANSSLNSTVLLTHPTIPYTSLLSQLHLSIAGLPEELCPTSRPSSPEADTRSTALESRIAAAVQAGKYSGDLVRLRCTRRRTIISRSRTQAAPCPPAKLAETEEEWLEWERERCKKETRGAAQTRKTRRGPDAPVVSALDKVASWRSGLSDVEVPVMAQQQDLVAAPTLRFPVVKRMSVIAGKDGKGKAKSRLLTRADSQTRPLKSGSSKGSQIVESNARQAINATATQLPPGVPKGPLPLQHTPTVIDLSDPVQTVVRVEKETLPEGNAPVSDVLQPAKALSTKETLSELPDVSSCPLPSFSGDFATSTPNVSKHHPRTATSADADDLGNETQDIGVNPLFLPSQPLERAPIRTNSAPISVHDYPLFLPSQMPLNRPPSQVPSESAALFLPGPPSPPASCAESQTPPRRRNRAVSFNANPSNCEMDVDHPSPAPRTPKRTVSHRPRTPPQEDCDMKLLPTQALRTPEQSAIKRARTFPMINITHSPISPMAVDNPSSKDTPVTAEALKGLGNAKGLPIPRTPDKHAMPALMDILATSRQSKTRPRPPSRKSKSRAASASALDGDPFTEDDQEVSPTKSYMSSPASGSSGSTLGSTRAIPNSPMSPLFTQNPGLFAPFGASTQPRQLAGSARQNIGFGAFASRPSSQFAPAKGLLGSGGQLSRASSGLFGMAYNSQFDVDANVNHVSNFLEKDVDFDAWVRVDDDGEGEGEMAQVEQLVESLASSP